MNITVYLGANPGSDPALRDAVRRLGTWIGDSGHALVYGGSKSGLMGELAESVLLAGGEVTGVEPRFFVDAGYVYDAITRLIVTEDMARRKAKMIELGDAFIAFPGGTGTLEEIAEVMSKVSLGHLDAPCILYNLNGYYDALKAQLGRMIEKGLSSPEKQRGIAFADDLPAIAALLSRRDFVVRALGIDQVRAVYRERMKRDFPPDELKPLERIERAMARGEYACYGAFGGGGILAYAFFVLAGRRALFDYYAVAEDQRDRGIGSRFIRALMDGPLSGMDCVLLEVDDPDSAATPEEEALRRRRLAFYIKNGLADTGVRATVYGVDFTVLALPVGNRPSREEAGRLYGELYHVILPPELYDRWVVIHEGGEAEEDGR